MRKIMTIAMAGMFVLASVSAMAGEMTDKTTVAPNTAQTDTTTTDKPVEKPVPTEKPAK
ncbi:hypothetical protein Dacet_1621 [Denitrovibrio acetiphilus DSM 12809]|uniref:Uncharacterized protein n=1 Tax=Denitrovibrio acetiphilus (strain DSM 12809 / NBRC 114555 / N2460) TaxID=522772 RepID=D4H8N8_DENA2|nr:hypothetical protein [Denitrovibrio acetiphilus]ADD68387.1 hypothetical protein Dacet_1621 [Denitrovibrio acetiphilus DSM 12809]